MIIAHITYSLQVVLALKSYSALKNPQISRFQVPVLQQFQNVCPSDKLELIVSIHYMSYKVYSCLTWGFQSQGRPYSKLRCCYLQCNASSFLLRFLQVVDLAENDCNIYLFNGLSNVNFQELALVAQNFLFGETLILATLVVVNSGPLQELACSLREIQYNHFCRDRPACRTQRC